VDGGLVVAEEPHGGALAREDGVEDGLALVERRHLREVADGEGARDGDRPAVRRLYAGDDPEEGRLARPVPADHAHLAVVLQAEGDVFEERLDAVGLADGVEDEGGHPARYRRGGRKGLPAGPIHPGSAIARLEDVASAALMVGRHPARRAGLPTHPHPLAARPAVEPRVAARVLVAPPRGKRAGGRGAGAYVWGGAVEPGGRAPAKTGTPSPRCPSPVAPLVMSDALTTLADRVPGLAARGLKLSRAIHKAVLGGGPLTRKAADFLHGTWLGHPVHVVVTDVAVGAWVAGACDDAVGLVTGARFSRRAGGALAALGTASALPTAVTGLTDYATVPQPAAGPATLHAAA